jgi:hypothetical protein
MGAKPIEALTAIRTEASSKGHTANDVLTGYWSGSENAVWIL